MAQSVGSSAGSLAVTDWTPQRIIVPQNTWTLLTAQNAATLARLFNPQTATVRLFYSGVNSAVGDAVSPATLTENLIGTALWTTGFDWVQSVAQAGEWHLTDTAGGSPFITEPTTLKIDGVSAGAAGTLGSLAADKWGFGDNDTLGYDTIYVRVTGDGDPDAKVAVGGTITIEGYSIAWDLSHEVFGQWTWLWADTIGSGGSVWACTAAAAGAPVVVWKGT